MSEKRCTKCKYFLSVDSGYSNYTVEETELDCLKNNNAKLPATESYRFETEQSDVNAYAEKCEYFSVGDGPCIDVDQEEGSIENYSDDPEVKEALIQYFN